MNGKLSIVLTLETVVCAEVPTSTRKLVLFFFKNQRFCSSTSSADSPRVSLFTALAGIAVM